MNSCYLLKSLGVGLLFLGVIGLSSCRGSSSVKLTAESESKSAVNNHKPVLRVFLENSGSMDGYMCEGSQLKDVIFDYVGSLKALSSRTALYYINSDTIPFKGSFESFIETMSPEHFKKASGNRGSSDIRKMLERVVSCANDSTVCLFVSDCILDLPVGDTQKFLNNCRISIKNTMTNGRKRLPNLGVEVLKMSSDFTGKYFYPNNSYEELENVKRPYYIWVIGDCRLLAQYNKGVSLDELKKYGFEQIVSFTPQVKADFDVTNRSTTTNVVNPENGNYRGILRADFSGTLQPESEVLNPANYTFSNPAIRVEGIRPVKVAGGSKYTHMVEFAVPVTANVLQCKLMFKAPAIPRWVEESHDEAGIDIQKNMNKTSDIKHQIEGVADAYRKETASTEFIININRN